MNFESCVSYVIFCGSDRKVAGEHTKTPPIGINNILSYLNIYHMLGIYLLELGQFGKPPLPLIPVLCSGLC